MKQGEVLVNKEHGGALRRLVGDTVESFFFTDEETFNEDASDFTHITIRFKSGDNRPAESSKRTNTREVFRNTART